MSTRARGLGAALLLATAACPPHALQGPPPSAAIKLPADHGAHLAQTEWWHFHGHLADAKGRRYDFFLGFVRWHTDQDQFVFVPVRWAVDPGQVAVFALLDRRAGRYLFRDKYAYPDIWAASAAEGRLDLRHDDWSARMTADGMRIQGTARGASLDLTLAGGKPAILEGRDGLFDVPGSTSHLFYTLPRLEARGRLVVDGEAREVKGEAWMKHQWGYLYEEGVAGWVWFGVQLANGTDLQIGLLKDRNWDWLPGSFAEVVTPDGRARRLDVRRTGVAQTGEAWTSPASNISWPVGWRLVLPEIDMAVDLLAPIREQELWVFPTSMWAGFFDVSGRQGDQPVTGRAMAEVFGLEQPFLRRFYGSGARASAPGGDAP